MSKEPLIAQRRGGVVYYLHGDHLGSTSLVTSDGPTATVVSRVLYYPYGETRWLTGTLTTEYQYTGQRAEHGLGLYDYVARFYDPALGRFISADTIVPGTENPQNWNRYSYTLGNPLRYVDPSGHRACLSWDESGRCTAWENPSTGKVKEVEQAGNVRQMPKGPGIPVSPKRGQQARVAKTGALFCDTMALVTSVVGAMVEWAAIAVALLDGPEPGAADAAALELEAVVLESYVKYFNTVKDGFGLASLSFTAVGDVLGGYTYLDTDSDSGFPELIVGEDTLSSDN